MFGIIIALGKMHILRISMKGEWMWLAEEKRKRKFKVFHGQTISLFTEWGPRTRQGLFRRFPLSAPFQNACRDSKRLHADILSSLCGEVERWPQLSLKVYGEALDSHSHHWATSGPHLDHISHYRFPLNSTACCYRWKLSGIYSSKHTDVCRVAALSWSFLFTNV